MELNPQQGAYKELLRTETLGTFLSFTVPLCTEILILRATFRTKTAKITIMSHSWSRILILTWHWNTKISTNICRLQLLWGSFSDPGCLGEGFSQASVVLGIFGLSWLGGRDLMDGPLLGVSSNEDPALSPPPPPPSLAVCP